MSTIPSYRRFFLAAAVLSLAILSADVVRAQDYVREGREAAQTWGMQWIAAIQAEAGDVQGAKRTLSQIDEDGEKGPSEVTVVWFCNGQPVYDHPPASVGYGGYNGQGNPSFFRFEPAANHVPLKVPDGLPSNYLAPDPRHGVLVDFADEYDSRGTRVTSRTYANGYTVIETPHPGGQIE